ncbi:MAG: hypothetical protein SFW64_05585 [Alphaproteobacteria bacterium]|nr:hypothetical protein [Alphaproteobacteria bacterium]
MADRRPGEKLSRGYWRGLVGGAEAARDRVIRDVMQHVPRLGQPVEIPEDARGYCLLHLPEPVVQSINNQEADRFFQFLEENSLPTGVPDSAAFKPFLGTKALVLWLDRGAFDPATTLYDQGGKDFALISDPFIDALSQKFHLPLHAYQVFDEHLSYDQVPTPSALILATDKEHQAILHNEVMLELGNQRRQVRAEGFREQAENDRMLARHSTENSLGTPQR